MNTEDSPQQRNAPIAAINQLWGGSLTHFALDPITQRGELRIRVLDKGVTENYLVTCSDVVECRFSSNIPGPWSYAEVTQVEADYDHAAALWLIDLMLWSEEAGISIRCSDISINAQPLDVPRR
jgi:hypothetical protein